MTDREWFDRAVAVTPGGSQTRSKAPGRVGPADRRPGFPLFADRGIGPFLFGVDGERYLDFAGANAAVPLGYGRPEVLAAVAAAAGSGSLLSLPSTTEIEVSEEFCRMVGVDLVRWTKTGSEAVAAAVRLARAATGASDVIVARHSYHGWHDWTLARFSEDVEDGCGACFPNGVPSALKDTIHLFDYEVGVSDMAESLRQTVLAIHRRGHRVAAILLEPHRFLDGQQARVRVCREVATRIGAALIFDEMVYGFRWALGGGREYWGGEPDLSCYGKAIANGVPLACVCGAEALMRYATQTFVSGTYGGDRLGLAACRATMRIYRDEDVISRLWANGRTFFQVIAEAAAAHGWYRPLAGFPVHFAVQWNQLGLYGDQIDDVLTRCAQRGVLFHRDADNASAAMTTAQIEEAAQILVEEVERRHASLNVRA